MSLAGSRSRIDELVVETVVIPLEVVVHEVLAEHAPNMDISEGHDAVDKFGLDAGRRTTSTTP